MQQEDHCMECGLNSGHYQMYGSFFLTISPFLYNIYCWTGAVGLCLDATDVQDSDSTDH